MNAIGGNIFFNQPSPVSFSFIFRFFQTDIAILQEKLWENVHPVYNAKIRTHHIQHASIIVKPIDPGTRKILLNQR